MKLIKDLYKNEYLLSVLSRILLTLIGVFHSVFIARFLGPELKGVTATIQSYIGILAIFMTLGLQEVYPYYRRQMTDEFILQRYTTLVKLIFFVFESLSFLCIFIMHFDLELTNAFALVISPITAYATIISYIYLIENAIKRNIVFVIISFFETFIVLILMLFVKANYFWVFIIVSFSDIVKAVYFTVKLKVKFDFRLINISFLLSTIKRGIFPMIALVLTGLNYKIDIIMLNGFDNVNMSDIGIYSVGVALADKTVYIPEAVREILLSKLTKGADKFEVAKVIRWCLFISGLTLFFLILCGNLIIRLLYGLEYSESYSITIICMFGTALMVVFKMISQWNVVAGRQIINALMLSISIIINVFLNLILIPRYNIYGAAIASVLGYLTCAILFLLYFSRKTKIPIKNIIWVNYNDFSLLITKLNFYRRKR